jgi:hypothetical protein
MMLPPDQEDALVVGFIKRGYPNGNFDSPRDVLSFVEEHFGKCFTYGWIESFLARNATGVCHVVVSPQESIPPQIPRDFFDGYMILIKE